MFVQGTTVKPDVYPNQWCWYISRAMYGAMGNPVYMTESQISCRKTGDKTCNVTQSDPQWRPICTCIASTTYLIPMIFQTSRSISFYWGVWDFCTLIFLVSGGLWKLTFFLWGSAISPLWLAYARYLIRTYEHCQLNYGDTLQNTTTELWL